VQTSQNHPLRLLISVAISALFCTTNFAQDEVASFQAEQIKAGSKLYADNCAVCHGQKMVDSGGGFFDLRTFPPKQRPRFINSVSNGKNSMPPWKSVLSQEQIGNLFAYVVVGEKTKE
jgi:mono/diheme cytochrome c family protein